MRDPRRAVQGIQAGYEMRGVVAGWRVGGTAARERRREAARLQQIGAEFIDCASAPRLDCGQEGKEREACHFERCHKAATAERILTPLGQWVL